MAWDIFQANDIIAQLESHNRELITKLESTQRQLTILQHQMELMLKRVYGRKSEKIMPGQLLLDCMPDFLNQLSQEQPAAVPEPAPETPVVPKAPKTPAATSAASPFPNTSNGSRSSWTSPRSRRSTQKGNP
jgi:hypothetical protein